MPPFAIDHALNASFHFFERHRIDVRACSGGRIGVASGAGEIAGIDDLDQGETGGKFFLNARGFAGLGVASESSDISAVR
jgi:hypothetical protein